MFRANGQGGNGRFCRWKGKRASVVAPVPVFCQPVEVFKKSATECRSDGFRMKLYAPLWQGPVPDCHDGAVFGMGSGNQCFRESVHGKGMVSDGRERGGDMLEQAGAVVCDIRASAVTCMDGGTDMAAMKVADALMSQTNAEYRYGVLQNGVAADAEVTFDVRASRTGRNHDIVESLQYIRVPVTRIVRYDGRRTAIDGQNQVVKVAGKGIVVVDQQGFSQFGVSPADGAGRAIRNVTGLRARLEPATISKRNRRHSIGPL